MIYFRTFLRLPLYSQITINLVIILALVIFFVFIFLNGFKSSYFKKLYDEMTIYFLNFQKKLIENEISFTNICLLQYENLIKKFNYHIYENIPKDLYSINRFIF